MQTYNRHSINKVYLEVNTVSKKNAYFLKDNLDMFLKDELFPLLETYFNTLDKKMPLHSIQVEKLNMDISLANDLDLKNLKLDIMGQFQKQIEKQIETGFTDAKNFTLTNNKEKDVNEFFSFLETGTNPLWEISKNENQFEKIIAEKAFGLKLLNALQNRQMRIRFIKQLSDDQIYSILKNTFFLELSADETSENKNSINSFHSKSKQALHTNIGRIKENMNAVISQSKQGLQQRNLIWDIILSQLLSPDESIMKEKLISLITSFDIIRKYNSKLVLEETNKHIINKSVFDVLSNLANEVLIITTVLEQKTLEILQKNKEKSALNISKTEESSKKSAEKNSILNTDDEAKEEENLDHSLFLNEKIISDVPSNHYVNNAGLILVHPFLKHLFENCELLNKDNTIKDPEVAAHLLHYIATDKEQDYEHEMLFEKLLCNIPLNQPINRNIALSEELKNHGNEMLRAVLSNWSVMQNSSVALLQNEYLQRPGKIILTEDSPKILVERKTQDILLDRIPWNLGIVKLAWKNKVIFVDW